MFKLGYLLIIAILVKVRRCRYSRIIVIRISLRSLYMCIIGIKGGIIFGMLMFLKIGLKLLCLCLRFLYAIRKILKYFYLLSIVVQ